VIVNIANYDIRHALDVVTYKSVKVVPWSIEFNVDGSFKSIDCPDNENLCNGCSKSIEQLYKTGRAFNIVSSKTIEETRTDSFANTRPDAIICNDYGDRTIYMAKSLVVFGWPKDNKVTNYHDVSDNDNYITFNSDETGTGKQISGTGADGCVGKSLEGLYKEGHAFNFNRIEKPNDSCVVSTDYRCGRLFDFKTCPGNQFCSKLFWCGDSDDHKNSQDPEFSSGITNPQCPQQITKFDGWPDVILCDIYYHYFNKFDTLFFCTIL